MKEKYYSVKDKCNLRLSFTETNEIFAPNKQSILFSDDSINDQLDLKAFGEEADEIAIEYYYDFREEIEELKDGKYDENIFDKLKECCFRINPYIHKFDNEFLIDSDLINNIDPEEDVLLLKTHCFNYVVINKEVVEILSYLNEENTLENVYNIVKKRELRAFILNGKMEKHSWKVISKTEILIIKTENDFLKLIGCLLVANLIELKGLHTYKRNSNIKTCSSFGISRNTEEKKQLVPSLNFAGKTILLLAATPGAATIGLLYIASYLKRNGINAYCKYNNLDVDINSLKNDIGNLLNEIKPQIVAVSIKWFVHMRRGIEICKIIKSISDDIEIVVGGNTAALYCDQFIKYDFIDYVVCGDGELPILKICKEDDDIPNCVYKKNGRIIKNPITYIQNRENSKDIYLSHLDDILVSKNNLYCVPNYYIYTGKGCIMNCCYCGGCIDAQKEQFGRHVPFLREIREVRKDLFEIKKYASTFMFIDSFEVDVLKYYKELWNGIDLSNHFCHFYLYKIPSPEFIKVLSETFKYIYINVDLCSFSERHRLQLHSLGLSKPLPSDDDLLTFLSICDEYKNTEISVSLISGLPYYTKEDMKQSEILLNKLLMHSSFKGAEWGRLHAQPGAPIVKKCNEYGMYTQATSFDDFFYYSTLNMNEAIYPDVYSFKFPYIMFEDNEKNEDVNKHYNKLYSLIKNSCFREIDNTIAQDNISVRELYNQVQILVEQMNKMNIESNSTICIIARPSINMIISILAAKKITDNYILVTPDTSNAQRQKIVKKSSIVISCVDSEISCISC